MSRVEECKELDSYKETIKNEEWILCNERWKDAWLQNKVFELVPRLVGKKVISSKWVYEVKHNANGTIC